MVYVARDVRGKVTYLKVQRSYRVRGKNKTEHVKYLGNAENYTAQDLAFIIKRYNQKGAGRKCTK
jgi:hypothetical protein